METASRDLDLQAHCRSLALQQMEMLTRIAEIGMRLVEAEGAKAIAQAEQPQAGAPGTDAPTVVDHGLAFGRHARTVHWALAQRARAADRLCAHDTAARKARRGRQRNQVAAVLETLIWDPAGSSADLNEAEYLTTRLREDMDELYRDEEDPVEDRPFGSVVAGLACGLGLSDQWQRRAADLSDPPYPPPPSGTVAEVKARRHARMVALADRAIAAVRDPARIPGLRAGLEARLREPDVEALLDLPPAPAAERLCRSLALEAGFRGGDEDPDDEENPPDTG